MSGDAGDLLLRDMWRMDVTGVVLDEIEKWPPVGIRQDGNIIELLSIDRHPDDRTFEVSLILKHRRPSRLERWFLRRYLRG